MSIGWFQSWRSPERPPAPTGCLPAPEARTAFSEAQTAFYEAEPMRIEVTDRILVLVDGDTTATATLRELEPATIESIKIIKGPAAAELYGSRGAEGVILIATRAGKRGANAPDEEPVQVRIRGDSAVPALAVGAASCDSPCRR